MKSRKVYRLRYTYKVVWSLKAPRWYIGPIATPRATGMPRATGCDSRPMRCRRDNTPAKNVLGHLLQWALNSEYEVRSVICRQPNVVRCCNFAWVYGTRSLDRKLGCSKQHRCFIAYHDDIISLVFQMSRLWKDYLFGKVMFCGNNIKPTRR